MIAQSILSSAAAHDVVIWTAYVLNEPYFNDYIPIADNWTSMKGASLHCMVQAY